jgi:hypothetical protein
MIPQRRETRRRQPFPPNLHRYRCEWEVMYSQAVKILCIFAPIIFLFEEIFGVHHGP